MTKPVISVEHLTKQYDLGVIGTGTISRDLNRWWARVRKQPDPYTRIGQKDAFERIGETILALDDVSFTVQQGEALGIIGRNGAGKSTLLKILSRVTAPTSGVVKVKGRIGSLLEVGTGFHPELTGRENVYLNGAILGMKKEEVTRKFDEIVDFSGVEKFIDTPVKRYSSGMYVRLAFAVAAHLDPEILIVDEVLAVGDAEFQKKCLGKMGDVATEGRTVLFVSHNMAAVEQLCQNGILLQDGRVTKASTIENVVNEYLKKIPVRGQDVLPHSVIFQNNEISDDIHVTSVEIEDLSGKPKNLVFTWDDVVLSIKYYSNRTIKNGSLVIKISDHFGKSLILLSSQPDSKIPMTIKEGFGEGKCIIRNIPLTGGDYIFGCGLAVPNREWLWWNENLGTFSIEAKDVFESGLAPKNTRSLIAVPHDWKLIP